MTYKRTLETLLETLMVKYEKNPNDEYLKIEIEKYSNLYRSKYGNFYRRKVDNALKAERGN